VEDHPLFRRVGRDIFIRLPVTTSFAKQGGQLQVPNVEGGFILLDLPPETRHRATIQVYEDESYSLSAIIEVYQPWNPFALLRIWKRLRAIERAVTLPPVLAE
jgi:hypothetical protein